MYKKSLCVVQMSEEEELIEQINDDIDMTLKETTEPLQENQQEKGKFFTYLAMWLSIAYSASFEVIGSIIGVAILFIAVMVGFIELLPDGTYDQESNNVIILLLVINAIATVILGVVVFLFNKKASFIETNREQKLSKEDGKILLGALSFMFFIIAGLETLVSFIVSNYFPDLEIETPYDFFNSDSIIVLIVALISVTLFAPIVEELFYRKAMMDTLAQGMNKYATVIFSALIFSLAHSLANLSYSFFFFVFHLFVTLFLGIIIGIVYQKTKKILSAIILHGFWNLFISIGAIMYYFELAFIYDILYLVMIGLGAIGALVFSILFLIRRKKEQPVRKEKTKIKLKSEWFVLVLTFAGLIVIVPFLIQKITASFEFGEGIINLIYLGVLLAISTLFVTKDMQEYQQKNNYLQRKMEIQ